MIGAKPMYVLFPMGYDGGMPLLDNPNNGISAPDESIWVIRKSASSKYYLIKL